MRRAPVPGLDLGVYAKAVPLLLRNPAIVVIPLLMGVIGVLIALAGTIVLFSGRNWQDVQAVYLPGYAAAFVAAFVWAPGGQVRGVVRFTLRGEHIISIDVTGDAEKIRALDIVTLG